MTTPTEALIAELLADLDHHAEMESDAVDVRGHDGWYEVRDAVAALASTLEASLPRTVSTVAELDALGRVLGLHKSEKRYYPASINDHSFDSAEEAREWADSDEEDIEFFEICAECGRVESEQLNEYGEEWGYRESLWPCKTITAIGDEAAGLLVTPEATA